MKDNVIKCLLIKSFEIYKDKRIHSNLFFSNDELTYLQNELVNTLDLSLYDIEIKKSEIIGSMNIGVFNDNIASLKSEIINVLGMFKDRIIEEETVLRNDINVFAIINRSLFDKGYCMDVSGYFLFSDLDEYRGDDSYFVCRLLTLCIKKALNNKLSSTIYFGETFS